MNKIFDFPTEFAVSIYIRLVGHLTKRPKLLIVEKEISIIALLNIIICL